MGGEQSTLNCCARTRGGGNSLSSREDDLSPILRSAGKAGVGGGGFEDIQRVSLFAAHKDGYLHKMSAGREHKPRFFMVKNDLYYFATRQDKTPKGTALLFPWQRLPVVRNDPNEPLGLEVKYHHITFLRAENTDTAHEWSVAITAMLEQQASGPTTPVQQEGPGGVLRTGFLEKKSFADAWKRYWCVLAPGCLHFYTTPEDAHPKSTLDLTSSFLDPEASVLPYFPEVVRVRHCRTLSAVAESEEDRDEWVQAIQDAIGKQAKDRGLGKKNAVGWKRTGKVREVIVPIVDLLRDPLRVGFFRDYLRRMQCAHLLQFWLEVQQFKRLCKKEDKRYLKPCAVVVYGKFVKAGAQFDMAIPNHMREKTLTMLDASSSDTFKDAQLCVLTRLRDEHYAQFLTSSECAAMARALFGE